MPTHRVLTDIIPLQNEELDILNASAVHVLTSIPVTWLTSYHRHNER